MTNRERAVVRGMRRGEQQSRQVGSELREARLRAGLSQQRVADVTGIARSTVERIELGHAQNVSIRGASILAAAVGLDLVARTYPGGSPIRDVAQVSLLRRLRDRLGPDWSWRYEVPIALLNDQRAWDAVIEHKRTRVAIMVEAETRLRDVQDLLRRVSLKRRDASARRLILLIGGTRTNREVVRAIGEELRASLPCPPRRALRALALGRDPGEDVLLML